MSLCDNMVVHCLQPSWNISLRDTVQNTTSSRIHHSAVNGATTREISSKIIMNRDDVDSTIQHEVYYIVGVVTHR